MRFAGQRVNDYTGGVSGVESYMQDSPDYGKNAQAASNIAREELVNSINQQGKTTATGILSSADAEAAKITGAAQASYADAQGQASVMSGLGNIGGSIIGGINVGGGPSWNTGVSGNDFNKLSSTQQQTTMTNLGKDMATWFR